MASVVVEFFECEDWSLNRTHSVSLFTIIIFIINNIVVLLSLLLSLLLE